MPAPARATTGALAALLAYALVFVALSIDVAARVWDWRGRFETGYDVAVLLYFEGMRSVVTLSGIGVAVLAARRAWRAPALAQLAFALAFATIAYTKLAAFRGFPGAVQEAVARALLAADTPAWLLQVVFGHPEWAIWPALAATMLFAAGYPRPVTPADVNASGARDRQGALRLVPLAGTDIGGAARRVAARLLELEWLSRPGRVWALAAAVAALHTLAMRVTTASAVRLLVHAVAALLAAGCAAVCIALFRGTLLGATPVERRLLVWLRRGALTALALFAMSAASGVLLPGGLLAAVSLSLAPAALVAGAALGCARWPRPGEDEGR